MPEDLTNLGDLVADGLLLVVIVLLVEQRRVDGRGVVDGRDRGCDVRLAAHGQVHRMLDEKRICFVKIEKNNDCVI